MESLALELEGKTMMFYEGINLRPRIRQNSWLVLQPVEPVDWKYALNAIFVVNYANGFQAVGVIKKQTFSEGYIELHPYSYNDDYRCGVCKIYAEDIKSIYKVIASYQTHPDDV
ncbi:hypothetical protein [Raineya sp.]